MLLPRKYVRKPFEVEAVEVTEENMIEVSKWCRGQIRKSTLKDGEPAQKYIKVNVKRALSPRQEQAYVGDWVVTALDPNVKGFKVYTPRAFAQTYDEQIDQMFAVLQRMDERAKQEDRAEEQEETLFPEELRLANKAS